MRLEREKYVLYIDANFGTGTPEWYRVGKDIEEMSMELNPDIETVKNILGETSVRDNGYEPTMDADPYYADPADSIYPKLRDIAMDRLKGDACKTKVLEVIIEDTEDETHRAWTQDAIIKPSSYGGDTSGMQIPFTLSFDGERVKGNAAITDWVPTFTAGAQPASRSFSTRKGLGGLDE